MHKAIRPLMLLATAAHLSVAPLATASHALAAAPKDMPAPYVSRAFDAVLLPINAAVRDAFAIDAKVDGVLVLATEPGGIADSQGVEPGDVISEIKGHKVLDPIDLDEVVYYWIQKDSYDFGFDYYRAGVLATAEAVITLELYEESLDVTTISSWEAVSVESFSYSEYTEEYSEEVTESYESSEALVEETASSEEFSEEATEEAVEDEAGDDAADCTVEASDDCPDDAEDDGSEDADDDGGDDGADDDGGDDSDDGGDDGGDDGSDEE